MKYYDLSPVDREMRREEIKNQLLKTLSLGQYNIAIELFGDSDTHTRKVTYIELGKLYRHQADMKDSILKLLTYFKNHQNEKVRQTVVYAAGEIACIDFDIVEQLIENGLNDGHHSVRNAATGALKIAANKNPSVLKFCHKYIQSSVPEVRRLVCHGLELRGRTHPQEIVPILKLLQYDKSKRVQDMLIHVLGQISYKEGCFYFVCEEIRTWNNKEIFEKFKKEVIEVHERYSRFSVLTVKEVANYFT